MRLILLAAVLTVSLDTFGLCVNRDIANLREAPTTKSKKTWRVRKYTPLKQVSRKGSWIKVQDVDGETHWIHQKLITRSTSCATVNRTIANLRTGPGTKFEKFVDPQAEKYASFKVLQSRHGWLKVLDEHGDTFWIAKKLVWTQ